MSEQSTQTAQQVVLQNIRLHALAWAVTLPSQGQGEPASHDFHGDWGEGFWAVHHRELGDYLLGYSAEVGVVGLQYEPLRDHDGQGQLSDGERTPEIYLRSPERSVSRGRAVPPALEPLARRVEKRKRGPSSGGFWVRGSDSATTDVDAGFFSPYLRQPLEALTEGFSANLDEMPCWGATLTLPPSSVDTLLTILEWPWSDALLDLPRDRAELLVDELRGISGYDLAKVGKMKKILASLGVAWPL